MEIKKQTINIGKTIYDGEIKTEAEGSIIVPDVKPDILKILQVDAEPFLCEKIMEDGKVTIKGKVNVNVLYVPEGENRCIQCLKGCFEFCETLKRQEFSASDRLIAVCEAEKVGYKLINSRKVGIDSKILVVIKVVSDRKCCFISDIDDENAQVRGIDVDMSENGGYREFCFSQDEVISFPQGKAAAEEILRSNVSIFDKEYKILPEKLVVKGKLCYCVLYLDINRRCDHIDFEIPFTEVFDIEGISEDALCDISYEVGDTKIALADDKNGDTKCISVKTDITACVSYDASQTVHMLTDCYFADADCTFEGEKIETEETISRIDFSQIMKELLQKNAERPDISGVYTVAAKPNISSTQIQGNRISVSGKTTVYVLYTTENPDIPVCSINEEIPFSYMIDCEISDNEAEAILDAECEHISYNINSANSVEIRCGIVIRGKLVRKKEYTVITDIELTQRTEKNSGVCIYFADGNDSIWDIGKKYHVSTDSICRCNEISENEKLRQGEKLIIPMM